MRGPCMSTHNKATCSGLSNASTSNAVHDPSPHEHEEREHVRERDERLGEAHELSRGGLAFLGLEGTHAIVLALECFEVSGRVCEGYCATLWGKVYGPHRRVSFDSCPFEAVLGLLDCVHEDFERMLHNSEG